MPILVANYKSNNILRNKHLLFLQNGPISLHSFSFFLKIGTVSISHSLRDLTTTTAQTMDRTCQAYDLDYLLQDEAPSGPYVDFLERNKRTFGGVERS